MEKQKPLALFLPPRLSSSQGSQAGKPQSAADFLQVDSREGRGVTTLGFGELVDNSGSCHYQEGLRDSDFENSEPMSRMYSKLYKEAEKIKKWKVTVESELKQKENKLQENRKIIEALRKAIKELQFENERVSLKLDAEIQENKELIKENNATRHLCNVLQESCNRSVEKTKKYEYEREETRQVHMDLNNSVEKMIVAFEELRVQAENSRLEMHFKLKEDCEKIQHLEEEYKKEVNDKENQVSLLLIQSTEKENKMKELIFLLEESRDKVNHLEEKTKLQDENLKESNEKKNLLASELEDIKMSLQISVSTQRVLEEDFQKATKAACQLTEEKEAQVEELNKAKIAHSFVVTEFKTTIYWEKNEDQLKTLTMELQKKSSELEEMIEFKNNTEVEVEELKKVVAENQKLLDEKRQIEKIIEELKGKEQELTGLLQIREKEIHDLQIQLTAITASEQHYSKQIKDMKAELEKEKLKNTELTINCTKLSLENKELAQETSDMALELKKQQDDISNGKKQEERMLKQIENLEETEIQLKNELESVKRELKQKGDEVKCKLDRSEENARSIECEVLRKDKQMKILENKCNNLRKQVENKSKHIEELQQENKALKKKGTADSKQINVYEIKVSKLELELESARQKFEEMTHNYQKEIEDKKLSEENLLGQVEKATVRADEAVKLQKEIDIRCQHKIAEMVALMEKHKHQYDKIVEERDSELGLCKSKEQEQSSVRASLEIELSNLKNELLSIKKQLEIEREEKEKLKIEVKEKKDKKIQTSSWEAPETSYRKFDSKATPLQNVSRNFLSTDYGKSKDKRDYMWTSAKSNLSTPLPKKNIYRARRQYIYTFKVMKGRKKTYHLRIIMVSEEDTLNRLYKSNSPPVSHLCVRTPKKTPSLTTPGSVLNFGPVRRMQDDRWAVIAKMDRKKKLKEAEKLFV
uniref:Synaptonemal complex protein 1 n=1 Tax=Cavia porcellus TaxID=10141 RepID=H0VM02_CAVPO